MTGKPDIINKINKNIVARQKRRKIMKKFLTLVLALVMVVCVGVGLVACNPENQEPEDTTIYVGNTAGVTGALASVGAPFNFGIEAAFAKYNAEGGFDGRQVKLKHYDDGGDATKSVSLMEKLIFEDEVFAIVGNFGSYAVNVNLETIKEEQVPMIYAAAGNDTLYNANATTDEDKVVFPVQPLNVTEGRSLIARAFAAAIMPDASAPEGYVLTGGLGATKVGVISNSNEASQSLLAGIKEEANKLSAEKKAAIIYQEVAGSDYSAAAQALVAGGCDVVIVTTIGTDYLAALTALSNANYTKSVLTSYNNASAAVFNDPTTNLITANGADILSKMTVYSQGWIDISSATYLYKKDDSALYQKYKEMGLTTVVEGVDYGVAGFNEEYWAIAEQLYAHALATGKNATEAFMMSYDPYALAGYIAGDLFCQGLKEIKTAGKELTRENLVEIMESKVFDIALGDKVNFQNGARKGVEAFGLSVVYVANGAAGAATVPGTTLSTIDGLRALIVG